MLKHILTIAIIIAILVGGYFFSKRGDTPDSETFDRPSPSATSTESLSSTSPTSAPAATKKPAAKKATPTPKPSTLQAAETYQDALAVYGASGYRFQFSSCNASPGSLTMKIGQKFMLDNRDATPRTVKAGSQQYNLGAYGFVIASAPAITGTHYITCDGGGTATILVQP